MSTAGAVTSTAPCPGAADWAFLGRGPSETGIFPAALPAKALLAGRSACEPAYSNHRRRLNERSRRLPGRGGHLLAGFLQWLSGQSLDRLKKPVKVFARRNAREETNMNRRILSAAVLAAAVSLPAVAIARVEADRGNIVSIDKAGHTIQLKDPKGRVGTWKYAPDATVKFTDGAAYFSNPSVNDLRAPMYVHFTFENEVIQSFDVVELGYNPAQEGSGARKTPGTPRTVTGRVTAYDPNVRQVELDINGERQTFQLTDRSDQRFQPGDRVQLRTEWSGANEAVAEARVLNRAGDRGTASGSSGTLGSGGILRRGGSRSDNLPASGNDAGESAQGRVVRITPRGVVMQVAGTQQTYAVDDSQLLQRLRVGDTVRFDWRTDRNGRMYITNVR
jgi:hypothetical protein